MGAPSSPSRGGRRRFYIKRRILELADEAPQPLEVVVLDCSMTPAIDLNASGSLCALAHTIAARGARLGLAELRDDVVDALRAAGAEASLGPIVAHRTIEECLTGSPKSTPFPSP